MRHMEKVKHVAGIRALAEDFRQRRQHEPWWDDGWEAGGCLYWALFTARHLRSVGIPAQIQAGTCYWPRLRPDQDDGHPDTCTQFGYQFEPGRYSAPVLIMEAGKLPEMHVWAAVAPATIIDVTTRYWPEQCQRLTGMDWPGDVPPDFLWLDDCRKTPPPPGVVYEPHMLAIEMAHAFIGALRGEGRL